MIEKKGRDPFTIRDGANYIITTNNDWFINPSKGARRFVALQMSDKYAGIADEEKEAYFDRIHQADARDLAKVLYTWDLQDFNPRKFAKTQLLQDQIEKGWDSVTACPARQCPSAPRRRSRRPSRNSDREPLWPIPLATNAQPNTCVMRARAILS